MDLSNFVTLRYLNAPASCFVAPLSLGVSRSGLYRLLPRLLEVLLVSIYQNLVVNKLLMRVVIWMNFRYGIGIFCFVDGTTVENEGQDRFVNKEIDPSSYEQIFELAEIKEQPLHLLKIVRLCEEMIGPSFFFFGARRVGPASTRHLTKQRQICLQKAKLPD